MGSCFHVLLFQDIIPFMASSEEIKKNFKTDCIFLSIKTHYLALIYQDNCLDKSTLN